MNIQRFLESLTEQQIFVRYNNEQQHCVTGVYVNHQTYVCLHLHQSRVLISLLSVKTKFA